MSLAQRGMEQRVQNRSTSPSLRDGVSVVETGIVLPPPAKRPGDKWDHSNLPKKVVVYNESCSEAVSLSCCDTTPAYEIRTVLADLLKIGEEKIQLKKKQGGYIQGFITTDTVTNNMIALGVKSFKRAPRRYENPIVVIGAGLGGIWQMKELLRSGRKNFVCIERHGDFGGTSWIVVSNKFTKLQTEKGCMYLDFIEADAPQMHQFSDGDRYPTWPSRDQILRHFREYCYRHGLEEYTKFNTSVEKTKVLNAGRGEQRSAYSAAVDPWEGRTYSVTTVPVEHHGHGETQVAGDAELMIASAIMSWPGNFSAPNIVEFPGEDNFVEGGGYIEYCSFDKVDYSRAEGKPVVLYGHGAFTIENVRTLLEHKASKVFVVCRKRNLTGMKVASWLCNCTEAPIPGHLLLKIFQKMYNLYNWDCWSAHSVQTDAKHTFAQITSKTIFGVNDVYFLAGYYGICEVVESEIKRVARGAAHLANGRKIQTNMIVKACGTKPDFRFDKMMGIKEMVGFWINGDPLRPCMTNGTGLNARNFSTFSSGPGHATFVRLFNWFIDYPEDFKVAQSEMPIRVADGFPAFVPNVLHGMTTMMRLGNALPALSLELSKVDALKSMQMQKCHPIEEFIAQCSREWDMYTEMFKKNGQIDPSTPACPYPYTLTWMNGIIKEVTAYWQKKVGMITDIEYNIQMENLDKEEFAEEHTMKIQDLSDFGNAE